KQLAQNFPHCEVDVLTVPVEGVVVEHHSVNQMKNVL
ncbi:homoserine kinase, partial [Bacillus altitudinis]|nr:homoserine kinase [Bacillus altitudinis]